MHTHKLEGRRSTTLPILLLSCLLAYACTQGSGSQLVDPCGTSNKLSITLDGTWRFELDSSQCDFGENTLDLIIRADQETISVTNISKPQLEDLSVKWVGSTLTFHSDAPPDLGSLVLEGAAVYSCNGDTFNGGFTYTFSPANEAHCSGSGTIIGRRIKGPPTRLLTGSWALSVAAETCTEAHPEPFRIADRSITIEHEEELITVKMDDQIILEGRLEGTMLMLSGHIDLDRDNRLSNVVIDATVDFYTETIEGLFSFDYDAKVEPCSGSGTISMRKPLAFPIGTAGH